MSKKDTAAAGTAEAPKKSRKKLIVIVLAAVLLLGGGGAYFMLGTGKSAAKPAPKPGVVVPMESVTVNLAEGHYLKMKLALQATADVAESPDGSKAMDLAIIQYTDMHLAELSSAQARAKVKAELLEKVKEAYEGEIMDIYFLEFVMQ
jgi:flagellar FliL protein